MGVGSLCCGQHTIKCQCPNCNQHNIIVDRVPDDACVFTRIENDRIVLDVRTITDAEVDAIGEAMGRVEDGS